MSAIAKFHSQVMDQLGAGFWGGKVAVHDDENAQLKCPTDEELRTEDQLP